MPRGRNEADLARAVVTELQRQGFETYEEVSMGYGEHRADIVAVRGPVFCVVECKVTFGLNLLNQLMRWLGGAHLVIGAHGFAKKSVAAERMARHEGFGLWSIGAEEINERVAPRLNRAASVRLLRLALREDHRSGEFAKAGSQGGYWTPFRQTCRDLTAIVKEQPGIELRAALKLVKHHYANERSAVSAIPTIIKRGLLPGMTADGKPLRLFLDGATAQRETDLYE